MGTGQDFRKQDEVLLAAKIATLLNVDKDGNLHLGKTPLHIHLPGKPGEPGKTPKKGEDYVDGVDGIGKSPKHQWDGTKIRFQNPDGTWGKFVDLKGKQGDPGDTPEKDVDYRDGKDGDDGIGSPPAHQWQGTKIRFQNPDKTWGEWVDLIGKKGDKVKGDTGGVPEHEWRGSLLRIKNPDGSWSKFVDLKGPKGKGLKGDKGYTPIKGKDYKDGEPGKNAVMPEALDLTVVIGSKLIMDERGVMAIENKLAQIRIYPKA